MAMSQIMDAMHTLGADSEFGKMFDQYIQKEYENSPNKLENSSTSNEGVKDQNKVIEPPTVEQTDTYTQMHPQQAQLQHQQYQNPMYSHQQSNVPPAQNNGHPSPYSQNQGYNQPHPSQHYGHQMRPHYPPQMGHGPQYHPQQRFYAPNTHPGQPSGYMMGHEQTNHPHYGSPMQVSHQGQMHPNGYPPRHSMMLPAGSPNSGVPSRPPMMLPAGSPNSGVQSRSPMMLPAGSPNSGVATSRPPMMLPAGSPNSGVQSRSPMMLPAGSPNSGVPSPGPDMTDDNQNGQPGQNGQWPSAVGKIKPKPRAPKKQSGKKKDPNEPTKPASAYALFFRERQAIIKGQNPNASFGEISKIVASMWDALEPHIKTIYKNKTEEAKKDYLQALAAYRASGVATGEQVSQYPSPMPSPTGYPHSPASLIQVEAAEPHVPLVQPPRISPGMSPNVPSQQMQGNSQQMQGNSQQMQGNSQQMQGNSQQMQGNSQQMPGNNSQMSSHLHHMPGPSPHHVMMPHGNGMPASVNPQATAVSQPSSQIAQYSNQKTGENSSPLPPGQQVTSTQYDPYGYHHRQSANHLAAGPQSFQGEYSHYAVHHPTVNPHNRLTSTTSMSTSGHSEAYFNQQRVQSSSTNDLYGQSAGSPGDDEGTEDDSSQSAYDSHN